MKALIASTILFIITATLSFADNPRYATITVKSSPTGTPATNTIALTSDEAAEIISTWGQVTTIYISKDGANFTQYNTADYSGHGSVFTGPATFTIVSAGQPNAAAYLTLKITPEAFPPYLTLLIPPGTNQVQVTMQSSTNLIDWAAVTNGIYGSPDTARFFRINMVKLSGP